MTAAMRVLVVCLLVAVGGAMGYLFARLGELDERQRELHEDHRRLLQQVEVIKSAQHIQTASKRFSVGQVSQSYQVWTEIWQDGVKTGGEQPPDDECSGHHGVGSDVFPVQSVAVASAVEWPRGSGNIELTLSYPETGETLWRQVRLPDAPEYSPGLREECWSLQFVREEAHLSGGEPVELFALTRSGITHTSEGIPRRDFADPTAQKLTAVVVKMRFVPSPLAPQPASVLSPAGTTKS